MSAPSPSESSVPPTSISEAPSSSAVSSSSSSGAATAAIAIPFEVRVLKAQIVSGVGTEIIAFFQVCTFDPASPAAKTLDTIPVRADDDKHALTIRWKRYNELDSLRKSIINGAGLYSEQELESTFPKFPIKKWTLTTPPDDRAMLTRRVRKFDAFLRHLSRLLIDNKVTPQVRANFEKWLAIDVGLSAVEHYQKQGGVRSSQPKGEPILLQWQPKQQAAAVPPVASSQANLLSAGQQMEAPAHYAVPPQPQSQPQTQPQQEQSLPPQQSQSQQQPPQQLSQATSSHTPVVSQQSPVSSGHVQAAPVVPANSAQPGPPSTVVRHTAEEIAEGQRLAAQTKMYKSLSPEEQKVQFNAMRLAARFASFDGWGYQNNATNVLEHWKFNASLKTGRRRMRSPDGSVSKTPFEVSVEIHISAKFIILKLMDPVKHVKHKVEKGPYFIRVMLPDEMEALMPDQSIDPNANALLASSKPPKPQRTVTINFSDEEFMCGDNHFANALEQALGVGHPRVGRKKYFAPNDSRNFCFTREFVEIPTPVAISKTGKYDFGD